MTTTSPNDSRGASVFRILALAVLVSAAGTGMTSCRSSLMGPNLTASQAATPASGSPSAPGATALVDTIHAMVPAITQLSLELRGDTMYLRGMLRRRSFYYQPFYGPTKTGGWCMQVFVDSDPYRSPYWGGYDYVVRGVEWAPSQGTFVVRQITLDPSTPGGWGPQVGSATFKQMGQRFEVTIPLAAVGGAERGVNYCLETYATVECAACSGGITHEWADDYFGSGSDARLRPFASRTESGGPMARLLPQAGHSAAMDPRLMLR